MAKILIIEDEKSLRENASEILSFEGHDVFQAENGLQGLDLLNEILPDLVLCDIMMPEMDGFEVLSAIRNNPDLQIIPIILFTALAERENIRSGMDLGADDYLTKPFTREELLRAVNSRLNKAKEVSDYAKISVNELRNNLFHHLPHELRTPLNSILGFSQILSENATELKTEEIINYSKNINKSGHRLNHLIQNYILYIQIISGKYPKQEKELCNAENICKTVCTRISEKYKRDEDLVLKLSNISVLMDTKTLEKIIHELCDNAFKFSSDGDLVYVELSIKDKNACISISDQGRGISAKNLKKLGALIQFDRNTYEQQGAGLGLSIAQALVNLYEGSVKINSHENNGTKISIYLRGTIN
jgi:two-component system, sensor histidine kinase and response regulator